MKNQVIANISTVGLFKNENEENYSLISFLELPMSVIHYFNKVLNDFASEEYEKLGVTVGNIEIIVPVSDNESAIVYGEYKIEDSIE